MKLSEKANQILTRDVDSTLNLPIASIEKRILDNAERGFSITTLGISSVLEGKLDVLKEHFMNEGYYIIESGKEEDGLLTVVFIPKEKVLNIFKENTENLTIKIEEVK